jgi:RNA polymerase I-specific transcription initiation factor RRN3
MENQVKETFKWIQALGKVITQLGKKETAVLIDAILNLDVGSLMEQSRDDESLFGKYVEFLENLVSAHAFYSSRVLEKLVFHLRKGPKLRPEVIEKERELKFERFSQRIHHALMNVLRIVPSSTTNLASLLLDHFPQKHDTAETHIQFTRQVLKICRYAPILRNQVSVEISLEPCH